MKTYIRTICIMLLAAFGMALTACDDDNTSGLSLDGETRVESVTISGFDDHTAKVISVNVSTDVDLTALRVDAITLSRGASCDYPVGTLFDGTVPRAIKVVNGNVFSSYTLSVKHDNVEFLTFVLNGKYSATIDNLARTIQCFVPMEADVTAMQVSYTVNEGTTVTPESGSLLDFSQPVVFTATQRTAVVEYTVTVVQDDMSQAPKAFIGNASSVEGLGDEAKAACRWMLENVPNSRYITIQDIIDWPGTRWDSRDFFNSYWLHGGAILASRDGARYINDVWRIARDQQSPNNMFGGDSFETLTDDLGFTITGHESHPLYEGLTPDADGRIMWTGIPTALWPDGRRERAQRHSPRATPTTSTA